MSENIDIPEVPESRKVNMDNFDVVVAALNNLGGVETHQGKELYLAYVEYLEGESNRIARETGNAARANMECAFKLVKLYLALGLFNDAYREMGSLYNGMDSLGQDDPLREEYFALSSRLADTMKQRNLELQTL
jgi:hypothetical protein